MTSQQNIFVFIDEDQQKKYSKTTLSAINAQVAKYAHKNRPFTPKSRSARRPPPTASTQDEEPPTQTNHFKLSGRKKSTTSSTNSQPETQALNLPDGRRSGKKRSNTSTPLQQYAAAESTACTRKASNATIANSKSEDLNGLLSRLCRITKHPTYQEFPFFLNIEERQLTHYCELSILINLC